MTTHANSEPRAPMRLTSMFGEILPLSAFFIGFQLGGIFVAAIAAAVISAAAVVIFRLIEKRTPQFVLFSTILSAVLTGVALLTAEATFIKIQPTIFNLCFAVLLLGGLMRGKAVMKVFFASQFSLTEATWFSLSRRWGLFMLAAALANEAVWRLSDEASWVFFKVFIVTPATGLFMLAQLPLTLRGRLPREPEQDEEGT